MRRFKSGEDVDLCWRFIEAGPPGCAMNPIALVAHDHRTENARMGFAAAKSFLRRSSGRHCRSGIPAKKTSPLVIFPDGRWVVWILLAMGSGYRATWRRWSLPR